MAGDDDDDGFQMGAKETLAGALITSSISAFIFKTDLPIVVMIHHHPLVVWSLGGIGTALALALGWVHQTNKRYGQISENDLLE